ncbi:MAG: hypothetical protein MUC62_06070 [Candidatus Thermoplasmatota archaeon]|jgi:translin|nr:hypothetical protein [Candidatus Thermoplasmatota archaeon]
MARPEEIRTAIETSLDSEEARREAAIGSSRAVVRDCRRAISHMVRTERPFDGMELLGPAKPLLDMVSGPEMKESGILEDPLTEVAEAVLLSRVLDGRELPLPSETGISERAYALGLCDALGEMRRVVLNRLLRGELEKGMEMYGTMKELFSIVEGLTYPSGMIQLKRKQDVVRGLLDRTAGELAISMTTKRMSTGSGELEP